MIDDERNRLRARAVDAILMLSDEALPSFVQRLETTASVCQAQRSVDSLPDKADEPIGRLRHRVAK